MEHRSPLMMLKGDPSLNFLVSHAPLSPMVPTQAYNDLRLPQEVLDLIIDEVARLKPVLASQAALRACTLVSRAFCNRSREHLWTDFVFRMDGSSRKRATDLIHMLRRKGNRSLVAHVRSMQLVFNAPVEDEQHRLVRAKNTLRRAIQRPFRKYFKPRYTVLDLLQHIRNSDFEYFSVNSLERTRPIYWTRDEFTKIIKPTLLEVLSSNTRIKSFVLCNIGSISKQMAAAAFFSPEMEDLTMRNLQFGPDELVTLTVERACVLADLRRLEMINVPMLPLLSLIHLLVPHSWPSDPLSSSDFTPDLEPQPLFPRLQTLVVSVPYPEDINPLWKLILGGASCLENLEMEYHYRRYGIPELGQLSLGRLTALRNFKFRTVSPDGIVWVEASQRVLLNIFTFPCFTEKLKSIELQYLFTAAWDSGEYGTNGKPLERLRNAAHWETIDDWLVSGHFRSLETLQLSVEIGHNSDRHDSVHHIPADEMLAAALIMFPKVIANARAEVILEGRIVFRLIRQCNTAVATHEQSSIF